jgi:hypothetical protein
VIVANNFELKLKLIELGKEFGITGDIEIDNGFSFKYKYSSLLISKNKFS